MANRSVRLGSVRHFGQRLPGQVGIVIGLITELVSHSGVMAFRGRSTGSRPAWLKSATDIRFVGHKASGEETELLFEAPTFGEAAPGEYVQQELWPTRPNHEDTAFEPFADVLQDISLQNRNSDKYDKSLLKNFSGLTKFFNEHYFQSLSLQSHRTGVTEPTLFTAETLKMARTLYETTPGSRQVKIYGTLDMIRASTNRFAMKLPNGEEVQGILVEGSILALQGLLDVPVVAIGKAVYRPSGKLLRIDAIKLELAQDSDKFFGKIPSASTQHPRLNSPRQRSGIEAIFGQWPGQETDEQIEIALRSLS
ncbi:MAG: hypothetical protein ACRC8S_11470 [Fimbriiglobus sp.]